MKIGGQSAFVTGGGQGIGLAICEALLERGAKVAIVDINEEKANAAATTLGEKYGKESVLFIKADVSSQYDIERAFKLAIDKFQTIDIVANNAGILNELEWERMLDINLVGVIRVLKQAEKYMGKTTGHKGGIVINTASINGFEPEPHWMFVYNATKFGVIGLTQSYGAAEYFKEHGIRVNAICPLLVDTDLANLEGRSIRKEHSHELTALKQLRKQDGTLLRAEDVATGFIQLVEDDSLCGKSLVINGKGNYFRT